MINIKIIGLGGIGSEVCEKISKFMYYTDLPCKITLIDGDIYERKNLERQSFKGFGNKAKVKHSELSKLYDDIIDFYEFSEFINEQNVKIIENNDIVFLCVDNHKTRRIVSNYCKTLNNVILISGGNELTDGNIQIYIRKESVDVTASLTDYHPEIINAGDKLPNELSCEELHNSKPQLLFTNAMAAIIMCCAFYNIINKTLNYGEVYFDIISLKSDSKIRKPLK